MRRATVQCLLCLFFKWEKRKFNTFSKGDKSIIFTHTPWISPLIFFGETTHHDDSKNVYVHTLEFLLLKTHNIADWVPH